MNRNLQSRFAMGFALAFWFGCMFGPASMEAAKVLILSNPDGENYRVSTPLLRQILTNTGQFEVLVNETPTGLTAETLSPFDVVVDNNAGAHWGKTTEKSVRNFVRSGKGLVVIENQSANDVPKTNHFFEVDISSPDNPIARDLKGPFKIADQLSRSFILPLGSEVIATAQGEPVLFTRKEGKGRVFCTALGHTAAALHEKLFMTTFGRGTEWAASGEVTLGSDIDLFQPDTNAVRALLITGGHNHEAAFYSLFNGYKDLAWMPVDSSKTAFQEDLRHKYDVLILYDFSPDLDGTGKQNLRNFVESGKGVVVLHHALLSYQSWPWWYEEVVGGRYLLSPSGGLPSSTYKGGQEFFVTPAGPHPITDGIGPFHLWDESYKGMWISPRVKPLLLTDNTNSSSCIAWISPYPKSRVVYIQLGHGHTAFGNPAYRALVHNAILWAAGRSTQPE